MVRANVETLERRVLCAAGELDSVFGVNGVVRVQVDDAFGSITSLPDGGFIIIDGDTFKPTRYDASGAPVPGYGFQGDGPFQTGGFFGLNVNGDIVIEPDGSIIVAGAGGRNVSQNPPTTEQGFMLVRFHPDGTPDQSFGTSGVVFGALSLQFHSVTAVLPDGRFLVGSRFTGNVPDQWSLVAFDADGTLLPSQFSGIGSLLKGDFQGPQRMLVQPDGKVVVVGSAGFSDTTLAIARFNPDGTFDQTFSGNGVVGDFSGVPLTAESIARDVIVVVDDGSLLVAGAVFGEGAGGENRRMSVFRVRADGSFDPSFGVNGVATVNGLPGASLVATRLLRTPDGKILAAGEYFAGANTEVVVARFNADGSLDTSFGVGGIVVPSITAGSDTLLDLSIRPDGKYLLLSRAKESFDDPDFITAALMFADGGPITDPVDPPPEPPGPPTVAGPDLHVTISLAPRPRPLILTEGTRLRAAVTVTNSGGQPAVGAVDIEVFQAYSETILRPIGSSPGDEVIGQLSGRKVKLMPGKSKTFNVPLTIGSVHSEGHAYHLLVDLTAGPTIPETDTDNNVAGGPTVTLRQPKPNYDVQVLSAPASLPAGSRGTVTVRVSNSGAAEADTPLRVALYASADNVYGLEDTIFLTDITRSIRINPGRERTFKLSLKELRAEIETSPFYIVAVASKPVDERGLYFHSGVGVAAGITTVI